MTPKELNVIMTCHNVVLKACSCQDKHATELTGQRGSCERKTLLSDPQRRLDGVESESHVEGAVSVLCNAKTVYYFSLVTSSGFMSEHTLLNS